MSFLDWVDSHYKYESKKQIKQAGIAFDKFLAEPHSEPTHMMGTLPTFLLLGITIDESIVMQDIPEGSTWWILDTRTGELSCLEEYDPTEDNSKGNG